MTTLTATAVRQNFFKLMEKVYKKSTPLSITMNGLPRVTVIPTEEYESWQETMEIMSDKKLMRDIRRAEKQVAEGKLTLLSDLKIK